MLYVTGVGREKSRDPYFSHLYQVGFDGRTPKLLTPEDAHHEIKMAPSGEYFLDSYSTPQTPPVAVLRDRGGKLLSVVEKSDIADC